MKDKAQPHVSFEETPSQGKITREQRKRHRYPFSLVWTPIHPISWLMPYVGHVGLADAGGRVIDFAGPYYVGFDNMLFGWPTRYYVLQEQLECGSDSWDPHIYELATQYEGVSYDFIRWNCHSFIASALNKIELPQSVMFRCLFGKWTVVSVAWLFFFHSRHLGSSGLIYTWGGHFGLWAMVIAQAIHEGSLSVVRSWLLLQLALLGAFAGWFSLLGVFRCDSQIGKLPPLGMASCSEPLINSGSDELEANRHLQGVISERCHPAHPGGSSPPPVERRGVPGSSKAGAAGDNSSVVMGGVVREPAELHQSSPALRPFRSEAPPMRIDSFGDVVALAPDDEVGR